MASFISLTLFIFHVSFHFCIFSTIYVKMSMKFQTESLLFLNLNTIDGYKPKRLRAVQLFLSPQ